MKFLSPLRNQVFNFTGSEYNPEEVAQWVAKYFGSSVPADKDQNSVLKDYYTKVMLFLTGKNLPVKEESIASNKSELDLFIQKPIEQIQTEIESQTKPSAQTCTGTDECLKCKFEKHKKLIINLTIVFLIIFVLKKLLF
ncbi:hypothetical protein MYP_652 [Sporocytophaga myxococcoides]|uniref:Uncharacterized protein n=1 Tax=Sporocytophaga myxococcoides TaxID=153721 RepID=A0A098L969_9BACT|nr:hypothetical protein [Sporocytophaga myxococcoides]GAL83425.1 hypothetical protein MYP_652 [Sporocytophaga myxococcoides]